MMPDWTLEREKAAMARHAVTTPGEWLAICDSSRPSVICPVGVPSGYMGGGHLFRLDKYGPAWGQEYDNAGDADFAAHAHQDLPDCIAALQAARAEVARLTPPDTSPAALAALSDEALEERRLVAETTSRCFGDENLRRRRLARRAVAEGEVLAMLRRAQGLGLMPGFYDNPEWWQSAIAELGANTRDWAEDAPEEDPDCGSDEWWDRVHAVFMGWLELATARHLASRDLRCILQPAQTARDADAPWWEVQPTRVGGMLVKGGVPFFDAPKCPGALGLLAAAVLAEEWRLAREAEATDAT